MSVKKIKPVTPPYPFEAYGHIISPLSADDGGGYMITFPDLPGCMSDGETMEEVLTNGRDAFNVWIAAQVDMKRHIPEPTHTAMKSATSSMQNQKPLQYQNPDILLDSEMLTPLEVAQLQQDKKESNEYFQKILALPVTEGVSNGH